MSRVTKICRRPRERNLAVLLKLILVQQLIKAGFTLVRTEKYLSDISAIRISPLCLLAGEIETQDHPHVVFNIMRDVRRGATRVVVLTPDERTALKISRRVARELEESKRGQVVVTTVETLHEHFK